MSKKTCNWEFGKTINVIKMTETFYEKSHLIIGMLVIENINYF